MDYDAYRPGVLLDLDGTLVDSVYQHVVAWSEAFQARGYEVALWRIHAAIGMGGKVLVPWLLGRHVDDAEELSDDHRRRFLDRAEELRPTRGAAALVDDLERRKVSFRIATSAESDVREALLDALGRSDLASADADDVGAAKPAPDLLLATCAELDVEPEDATLVGDSPWDAEAARRVGIRTLAVRCGGFGDDRLLSAGADAVVDDPQELLGRL
ncbi:MAG TPA: HAD family hydrolase [Egibacteraceae bacterium]|nr:HAD family hydrolase [Egibacteraceae bacterium]